MEKLDRVLEETRSWSEGERLDLARRLLAASDADATGEVERAWDAEIRERIARYDRGETTARPIGEALAGLDRALES